MFSNHIYTLPEENRRERLERARMFLREERLDFAIFCGKGIHSFAAWFTGIMNPEFPEHGKGGFILAPEGNLLEVDSDRIAEIPEPPAEEPDVMRPPEFSIPGLEHLSCFDLPRMKTLGEKNHRIGIVNRSRLSAQLWDVLARAFPDWEFPDVTEAALKLQAIKSEAETEAVSAAAKAHDKAYSLVPWLAKPGITEREIVLQLRHAFLKLGAAGQDLEHLLDICLTSAPQDGPSVPEPIFHPGRSLEEGDRINLTARCMSRDDYYAGLGRCFVLGKASEETRRRWTILLRAQAAAAERLHPGGTVTEAALAANQVLIENGFAPCEHSFISGTGLEPMEAPVLHGVDEGMPLCPGMTLVVAPVLKCEGEDDMVCMDTFAVTEEGCMRLTRTDQELMELEFI